MVTETDDPDVLRREITSMLQAITDHGTLLFSRWLLVRILNNEPVPTIPELRKLRGAFVRLAQAFRDRSSKIDLFDLALFTKYVSTGEAKIGRPLGLAVRFYRTRKNLTRLQLSKRCRMSVRAILALERGKVENISIPRFADLARGLGVNPVELMGRVMDSLKVEKPQKCDDV